MCRVSTKLNPALIKYGDAKFHPSTAASRPRSGARTTKLTQYDIPQRTYSPSHPPVTASEQTLQDTQTGQTLRGGSLFF